MLDMVKSSAGLFFQGRLFADTPRALIQLGIGIGIGVAFVLFLALAFAGLPLWAAGLVAGAGGGALQPVLFKNLRYR
jgi:hypothetical protein